MGVRRRQADADLKLDDISGNFMAWTNFQLVVNSGQILGHPCHEMH